MRRTVFLKLHFVECKCSPKQLHMFCELVPRFQRFIIDLDSIQFHLPKKYYINKWRRDAGRSLPRNHIDATVYLYLYIGSQRLWAFKWKNIGGRTAFSLTHLCENGFSALNYSQDQILK